MAKFERRAYRKSPGRQYGYDYDPLRSSSRGETSQSGSGDTSAPGNRWPGHEESSSRPDPQLAQRPDPRRTRQLLRQNILASKNHSAPLQPDEAEQQQEAREPYSSNRIPHTSIDEEQHLYEERNDNASALYGNRYQARSNRAVRPHESTSQQYIETEGAEEGEGNWNEFDYVDPDIGYEDPLDRRVGYAQSPSVRLPGPRYPASARRKEVLTEAKAEVFFVYAHKDEKLRNQLEQQLSLLKWQGFIAGWHDRKIGAGTEWVEEIDLHLNTASIILLLVSPDFMASHYCYGIEMRRAMERHEAGVACVIPIILRPVYWEKALFGKLQALPKDAKPVTLWQNRDRAFFDVAEGIRKEVEKLRGKSVSSLLTSNSTMSVVQKNM